jgi:hypothetical protein
MYRQIITKCWSIREVNKNLVDRETTKNYSIKFLKKSCDELAFMLRSMNNPDEEIVVVNQKGTRKKFDLQEVADMLSDVRKIFEWNLIDCIDQWAKMKIKDFTR